MIPKYLTCPFCPAQSYVGSSQWVLITQSRGITLFEYQCPARHIFYLTEEEEKQDDHSIL